MSSDGEELCIFCRIVSGAVPSQEVYGGPLVYAFDDVAPAAPVHVLVVPRQHIADATKLTTGHGDVLAEMILAARMVAERKGISEDGYRLVFNVGRDAGLEVAHLHMHVLGGRRLAWPPG